MHDICGQRDEEFGFCMQKTALAFKVLNIQEWFDDKHLLVICPK